MNTCLDDHQKQAAGRFRLCHHVAAGRSHAPKRCMLRHECFHCAYDQWLDAIDLVKTRPDVIAGASESNLNRAA